MIRTEHARRRSQQRGIPPLIVQWLQNFGEEVYDHHGGRILHFTKRARRRLEREVGREPIRRMHEWMDSYAVFSTDDVLITLGRRCKGIKHP
jgi:hypothetical protein